MSDRYAGPDAADATQAPRSTTPLRQRNRPPSMREAMLPRDRYLGPVRLIVFAMRNNTVSTVDLLGPGNEALFQGIFAPHRRHEPTALKLIRDAGRIWKCRSHRRARGTPRRAAASGFCCEMQASRFGSARRQVRPRSRRPSVARFSPPSSRQCGQHEWPPPHRDNSAFWKGPKIHWPPRRSIIARNRTSEAPALREHLDGLQGHEPPSRAAEIASARQGSAAAAAADHQQFPSGGAERLS